MRLLSAVVALLGASLVLAGCASDAGEASGSTVSDLSDPLGGLDVNDVSLLFPLRKVGSGPQDFDVYPRVALAPPLFEPALLEQLIEFGKDRGVESFFNGTKEWRVTALRYDPCFPNPSAPAADCHPQVRLVTQERRTVPGPGIDDVGMHLLFHASDALPVAGDPIVAELRAIQQASRKAGAETVGRTLGEHPGLAAEATKQKGAVGDLVRAFIQRHCSVDRLTDITFTGTSGGDDSWFFYGGHVVNGKWSAAPVPNLTATPASGDRGEVDTLAIGLVGIDDGQGVSPAPDVSASSVGPILDSPQAALTPATLAKLHRIDNPVKSTPENTDCASCHASSRLLHRHAVPFTGGGDEYENPVGVTGFAELALQPALDATSVRNFGWLMTKPVVTWLTANSSAAVASRVNETQGWHNPSSVDCRAPAVRECFAGRGPGAATTKGTAKECLKLCRPR